MLDSLQCSNTFRMPSIVSSCRHSDSLPVPARSPEALPAPVHVHTQPHSAAPPSERSSLSLDPAQVRPQPPI